MSIGSKIAVIGDGLTGQEVVTLLQQGQSEHQISGIYNRSNPVTVAALQDADVAIVFVPPMAMPSLIPLLLDARIDVVCGTTGHAWADDLAAQVAANHNRWVLAHNFSLGMNLVRHCLGILGKSGLLFGNPQYRIDEVHHTKKVDSPSGTAISWREWLEQDCDIHATREGDVRGIHQLLLETEFEKIELRHESKERALFAQGAIWAATYLATHTAEVATGITTFAALVDGSLLAGQAAGKAEQINRADSTTTGNENVSI